MTAVTEYGVGAARFAGATYDFTSHYRGASVFAFFEEQRLTPEKLHELSQHQVGLPASAFDALDVDPNVISRDRTVPLAAVGGFLALRTPRAARLSAALREKGVWTDYRGEVLRMGPAPYITDKRASTTMAALDEVLRTGP